MAKTLLVCQEKGGVGKTLIARGLAEILPGAPVIEVDAGPRMIELGKRMRFFPMRADRHEVDRTGGRAAQGEFDNVIDAIASATLPTIVDIGANTAVSLLTAIGSLAQDLSAAGVQVGLMVVTTAEPGALADTPKMMALASPWAAARFLVDNRFRGAVDVKTLVRIAQGAVVTCLMDQALDTEAAEILQAGGLASIPRLDAATLNKRYGIALGRPSNGPLRGRQSPLRRLSWGSGRSLLPRIPSCRPGRTPRMPKPKWSRSAGCTCAA